MSSPLAPPTTRAHADATSPIETDTTPITAARKAMPWTASELKLLVTGNVRHGDKDCVKVYNEFKDIFDINLRNCKGIHDAWTQVENLPWVAEMKARLLADAAPSPSNTVGAASEAEPSADLSSPRSPSLISKATPRTSSTGASTMSTPPTTSTAIDKHRSPQSPLWRPPVAFEGRGATRTIKSRSKMLGKSRPRNPRFHKVARWIGPGGATCHIPRYAFRVPPQATVGV